MAFLMALTLEPIKSLCTMRLVFLHDGLTQSPSEAVPLDLWEGSRVRFSMDGQSVALWEEVVRKSLCLFTGPCLLAAMAFCWFNKLLVTALPCCSLTV